MPGKPFVRKTDGMVGKGWGKKKKPAGNGMERR